MASALIAYGSNLGDSAAILQVAIEKLRKAKDVLFVKLLKV